MQKISPIKQRILQFVDTLGISKRDFYAKTGISRGTLESVTGITEETVAKFVVFYPEVNTTWLLIGEGEMYKIDNVQNVSNTFFEPPPCEKCQMKDELIDGLRQQIKGSNQQIIVLNKLLKKYEEQERPRQAGQKRKAV